MTLLRILHRGWIVVFLAAACWLACAGLIYAALIAKDTLVGWLA